MVIVKQDLISSSIGTNMNKPPSARVTVKAGTLMQFSEVRGDGRYLSQTVCACILAWAGTGR